MTNTLTLKKTTIKYKVIASICAIAASVVLPQIFHLIGAASGLGTSVGASFLPMHLTVLLAGFIAGPIVGVIVGALSPVISFAVSGMPVASMVPIMMVELASYGLAAGLLMNVKMPSVLKVLIAMVAGRVMRLAAVGFIIYALGNTSLALISVWNATVAGLPGIALELVIIPLLLYRINGVKKADE